MEERVTCKRCGTEDIIRNEEYLRAGCYYCPICGADITKAENIVVQVKETQVKGNACG